MPALNQHMMSRRGFCLCCIAATTLAAGGWLTPRQAFAEARNIVDLIRDDAAKAPIKVHKLRDKVSILEGSGGNIAVLAGADGEVFIDAGITASRPRILEAANGLSRDPIKYLRGKVAPVDSVTPTPIAYNDSMPPDRTARPSPRRGTERRMRTSDLGSGPGLKLSVRAD